MRRAHRKPLARQLYFFVQPRGHFVDEFRADGTIVDSHEHGRATVLTVVAPNRQRPCLEPAGDSVRLFLARFIAHHPHGIVGRDVHHRGPDRHGGWLGGNEKSGPIPEQAHESDQEDTSHIRKLPGKVY